MKYTNQIEVDLSRDKVVALFENPENYPKWQEGLKVYEPLNGVPGEVGAKTRLKFDTGKRKIEMLETVLVNELPDKKSVSYEAKGVYNLQTSYFEEIDASTTRYRTENEFKFSGLMKLLGWLMPGAFKKQSQKYLEEFKLFAEKEANAVHHKKTPR